MDDARATRMTGELMGVSIGGWKVSRFLGAGKSALVFEAEKAGVMAALKVFDPELVQRFGTDVQATRIERELSLRDKHHPNLVQILDGGRCKDRDLFFIVMERLDGVCLANVLKTVPKDLISPIISKIAAAANFLEGLGLVHRDIKPDNVFVSRDYRQLWLMDFGVIRPVGEPGITDGDQRPFIGTLQYSSPEFLFRTETDTPEGWRALTYYQLGAVLHDLITGQRLFADHESPFAALVEAVKNETARIEATDVSQDLILLAQSCLVKDPELRLRLVKWEDFNPLSTRVVQSLAEERIRKRQVLAKGQPVEDHDVKEKVAQSTRRTVDHVEERIQSLARKVFVGNEVFPPAQMLEWAGTKSTETNFLVRFEPSQDHALKHWFQAWFSLNLLEISSIVINLLGAASISTSPLESNAYDPKRAVVLFQGILSDAVLADRLSNFLYTAFDQAQSSADQIETAQSEVLWLPCMEETEI